MDKDISVLIDKIAELPSEWHGAGSVNPAGLRAIAEHAASIGPIRHSVETGSGKTTLLFSHLSADHRVFALDMGNSISVVRESPLLKRQNVTFIEGPTQVTLPGYAFPNTVQIALIDGPHGYPFPDMEYFHFYPILAKGGLLLVDDVQIPSISRMFEIIKSDDMFELVDIVSDNMAVFRRTSKPTFDPHGDGWWLQGYNRAHFEKWSETRASPPSVAERVIRQALRGVSAATPGGLKEWLPLRLKRELRKRMQ